MPATFLIAAASPEAAGGLSGLAHQFGIDWPNIVAQVLSFSIVALLLWRFAIKPVLETIEERQRIISEGLRHSEEMKERLAQTQAETAGLLKKASIEAQGIVNEARQAAKTFLDQQTKEAAEKATQMMLKAQEASELERRKILAEVRDEISRLVVLTSSRVLSRELNDAEKTRYTESAARELSNL